MATHQKNRVTEDDKRCMQMWGAYFARDNDRDALESAALYYAASANDEEAAALFFWWEEGVRNRTHSQYDTELCHVTLHTRTCELILESTVLPDHIRARTDYAMDMLAKR